MAPGASCKRGAAQARGWSIRNMVKPGRLRKAACGHAGPDARKKRTNHRNGPSKDVEVQFVLPDAFLERETRMTVSESRGFRGRG